MNLSHPFPPFAAVLRQPPQAVALVQGSAAYPAIRGTVRFYQTRHGALVCAQITGLPLAESPCRHPVFGFHIHSGSSCTGTAEDPFADALTHDNPGDCPHPYHAGDLPPLFGSGGMAFSAFLTGRFRVQDVLGRTVILHANPDDFTSQPAGNAGAKIACGVIRPTRLPHYRT